MYKTFILIDPDAVVRLDLSSMFKKVFPSASLLMFDDLASAAGDIRYAAAQSVILIRGSLLDTASDTVTLVAEAAARRCRIIKIGPFTNTDIPADWIDIPFRTETVMSSLRDNSSDGSA